MLGVQAKPFARSDELLVECVGDEIVAYDTESKEAHCLGPLAAAVFELCNGRRSVEQLAAAASQRLGEPVDAARVADALAQLEARRLLAASTSRRGLSRRDMIRRSTAVGAAAMAAPLVTSIVAPTAASAVTATCGPFTCCPCGTGDIGQPCCPPDTVAGVNNCNCTAQGSIDSPGPCDKRCKASGSALSVEDCFNMFPGTGRPPVTCPCDDGRCA